MRVLFIGGTGTISTACSRLCIGRRIDLWVANRGRRNTRLAPGARYIQLDINAPLNFIQDSLPNCIWDCVVDWTVFTPEQILRDIALFREKTKQYIFVSSASIYQGTDPGYRIKEDDPISSGIFAPYALQKAECENIVLGAFRKEGFPATVVRPGHTYAEFAIPTNIYGLGYGLVERIIQGKEIIVHDNGLSLWTLTHSNDFAGGLVGLIGLFKSIGETFHITSDEVLTWREIFQTFQELLPKEVRMVFIPSQIIYEIDRQLGAALVGDRAKNLIFDNTKIKSFVNGFHSRISFREGLKRALDWHARNQDKIYYNAKADAGVERIIAAYKRSPKNAFSRQ
jgi:nucleoside-diphosphate-sugar epimerase